MSKLNILYLCTGNSCRSQMAEVYTNALKGDVFQAYSAGVRAQDRVDPLAIQVLQEDPIINDIVSFSQLQPKTLAELKGIDFDYVVTVCDNANESCPLFPGQTRRKHQSFDDPPRIVKEGNLSGEPALKIYRDVRNQIKTFVQTLPQGLKLQEGALS